MARLSVVIGGDDRQLQAALKRSRRGLKDFGREMRAGIETAAKYAAAMAAVGAAIATHIINEQMKAIDATSKMSRVIGVATEDLVAYRHAAGLAGVDTATFDSSMTALIKRIGEARSGTGPLITFMQKYDQTLLKTLQSQNSNAGALKVVADAIHNAATEADAAAIANAAFSRQGVKMVEIFRDQGSAALAEAREEVEALGLAFSDIDARQVEQANDAMTRMRAAFTGIATQLAIKVAPIITAIADEFNRAAREGEGMGDRVTRAFDKMISAAGFVIDAVEGIKRIFSVVADSIIITIAAIQREVSAHVFNILKMLDSIPGLDFSESMESVLAFNREANSVLSQAMDNIEQTIARPMPSEGLKRFVEDAREAAEEAAKTAINVRAAVGVTDSEEGDNKEREAFEKKLNRMREQFATEQELLFEQREKQLEDIVAFEEQKLITAEEANRLREEVEQAHWDRIGEISEKASQQQQAIEEAKNKAILQSRQSFMSNLASLMNTESKKAFQFGKIAAMSQAAVSGAQSVMEAWRSGMETPGPFAPAVAAAYATAAGLNAANLINNIRKQSFGGASVPTAPTQGSSNISQQGAGGGQAGAQAQQLVNISLQGEVFGRQTVIGLIDSINEAVADGARIRVA